MKLFGINIGKRELKDAVLETPTKTTSTGSLLFGNIFTSGSAMALSAVYRCVDLISDGVAIIPIIVMTKDGTKVDHQLNTVFYDRNNRLTKYQFIKLLIQSVLLKGNGFAYIERNGDGSVKSLRFLESGDVTIQYNKMDNSLFYVSTVVNNKRIEPVNMIHLVKNSYDGVTGISVISFAANSINNAKNTETSASNFFSKGCNLNGVLKVQSSLTPQQIKDIKEAWNTTYSGGTGGISVLQGNMDYQPVQVNANDAQLIESRQFNVVEICRFFGVSPMLLGNMSGGSQYGTLEAVQQDFVLHTILPFIVLLEEEFTRKLLKPSESDLRINFDESYILKSDKSNEANYYATLVEKGILTRNEAREKLGYKPYDGADKLVIPYTNINDNTI